MLVGASGAPQIKEDTGRRACPRQVVIGTPRSGFALLCSVLAYLSPLRPAKGNLRTRLLDLFVAQLGDHISEQIVAVFEREGLQHELVYNRNFRALTGGPRWVEESTRVCYRKYIGARGRGDLMLVIGHPLALLDCDDIIHSHSNPGWWLRQANFEGCDLHSSIRNPAGIVNSSCFSLNALASEHIQLFIPTELDNDALRQELALYKLSDLKFFEGIVRFYVRFFAEFLPIRDSYAVMRWEDLILDPVATIRKVADAAGTPIGETFATQIWERLDHRNLTGHHHHNYRAGKGIVGDWRNWLTNHHLDILRRSGLEDVARALGYEPFHSFSEPDYTPFQQRLDSLIRRGAVHKAQVDPDLFGYAFNKSNIDASQFDFRQYGWRAHTRIERSNFADLALEAKIWDAAEDAAARINRLLGQLLAVPCENENQMLCSLDRIHAENSDTLRPYLPARYDSAFAEAKAKVCSAFGGSAAPRPLPDQRPPLLLYGIAGFNIVAHRARFFAMPQSLGPIDLEREDVSSRPGVLVSSDLSELERRVSAGDASG
jgi:Sulfotransferase domain